MAISFKKRNNPDRSLLYWNVTIWCNLYVIILCYCYYIDETNPHYYANLNLKLQNSLQNNNNNNLENNLDNNNNNNNSDNDNNNYSNFSYLHLKFKERQTRSSPNQSPEKEIKKRWKKPQQEEQDPEKVKENKYKKGWIGITVVVLFSFIAGRCYWWANRLNPGYIERETVSYLNRVSRGRERERERGKKGERGESQRKKKNVLFFLFFFLSF